MINKLKNFPYKNVLVLGLAKSGLSTANVLIRNNINVIVNDLNASINDPDVQNLIEKGADVITGTHPLEILDNIDLIVKNPGIPYSNIILEEALRRDITIITEVELAYKLLSKQNLIGITGSNGKTTTTTLVSKIFEVEKQPVYTAGNIGVVSIEVAEKMKENEKLLLELSSFQLQGTKQFKPTIACLLNLYEAHIDYHGSFENYVEAKSHIFYNQDKNDYLVYNADDDKVCQVVKEGQAQLVPFSLNKELTNGCYIKSNQILFCDDKIIDIEDILLVGEHNLANILAAIAIVKLSGVSNESIKEVLKVFTGVEHRLEHIGKKNGRTFYNDSKATNILATEQALNAFKGPIILLAGGLDRQDDFTPLIPLLKNVKSMILFGETKERLSEIGTKAGIENILLVDNMEDAVEQAYAQSDVGDTILLSPACASWDQYKTFEERGLSFIEAVNKIV